MNEPARYRAFISYRHADRAWGDWLHKSLESYRVPKELVGTPGEIGRVPARLTPVFRDREELGASADLGDRLRAALADSANLVVICTPRSAVSQWVNEEILTYKRLGRAHRIFALVADGEPNSADPAFECFPPALKYQLDSDGNLSTTLAEPLAADAREHADGKDNAKLKLIAGMIGVPYDKLRRRELEAQRRAFRRFAIIATSIAVIFAGLAAAAAWFGYQATLERDRAQANLDSALASAEKVTGEVEDDMLGRNRLPQDMAVRLLDGMTTLLGDLEAGQAFTPAARYAAWRTQVRRVDAAFFAGNTAQSVPFARQALATAEALRREDRTNADYRHAEVISLLKLSIALAGTGDIGGQWETLRTCATRARMAAIAAPGEARARRDVLACVQQIAEAAMSRNDIAGAVIPVTETMVLANRNRAGDRQAAADGSSALLLLAKLRRNQNRPAEAIALYREVLASTGRMVAADASDVSARYSQGLAHLFLADELDMTGQREEAQGHLRDALALLEPIANFDMANTSRWVDVADVYRRLGDIDGEFLDLKAAVGHYESALAINRRIVAADPEGAILRYQLGWTLMALAGAEMGLQDFAAAEPHLDEALALFTTLDAGDGPATAFHRDMAQAHERLAALKVGQRDGAAARVHLQTARALYAGLAAADPSNPVFRDDIARVDYWLARIPV